MLIASTVALGASLILSAETLQLARHPESALGCDLNSAVSCSAVAQSWQAEIVKFGGLSYPNAFFGIAALITTAILALALVLPAWAAAGIVTLVLLAAAAVVSLVGKKRVQEATPAKPERAMDNVKQDIAEVKGAAQS